MQICSSCWIILRHSLSSSGCMWVCLWVSECVSDSQRVLWTTGSRLVFHWWLGHFRGRVKAADVECFSERMESAIKLRDSLPLRHGFNHEGMAASDLTVKKKTHLRTWMWSQVHVRVCMITFNYESANQWGWIWQSVICDTGKQIDKKQCTEIMCWFKHVDVAVYLYCFISFWWLDVSGSKS